MRRLLFCLFSIVPGLVWSQGSQVNTQSQKLVGMAGAGTALFVDESSIAYNPGALAKMEHNALQIGSSGIMFRSSFRESGSMETFRSKFQISPPIGAYATFGPKGSWWKAGLGVYTPFGGAVDWGLDWPGRYALTRLSLRALYIQPTVSLRLTDNFSIGGGFIYNVGFVDLGRALPAFHPDGRPATAELSGVGTGMGYNIGVHYHLDNAFALSISYRSKIVTSLEDGDAEFDVPETIAANYPNTTFSSELPLPAVLNVGIAFPVSQSVKLAIDGTLTNYSIYRELAFEYGSELISTPPSTKAYKNAFGAKMGIDYRTSDKLALRAGVGYIHTPVRPEYVYPETPDNNRVVAAAGFTANLSQKWELTGAYAFQHILRRTSTNAETRLSGAYETYIHAPGISLTYKW